MKYYSEITKNMYNSVEDLQKAEKAMEDRTNERKNAAEKVDKAYNNMVKARKEYETELSDFCEKYGTYHKSIKSNEDFDYSAIKELLNILNL